MPLPPPRQAARRARFFLAIGLSGLVCGCAAGPDFHRPAGPSVTRYTPSPLPGGTPASQVGPKLARGGDVPADWWILFGSPGLNTLVERALKANPDLAAARAALRAAQETYKAQRGSLWPQFSVNYGVTRQQASATPAPPLTSSVNLFTLQTAQLNIAYTLDVFGGLRRQTEAAKAQADLQRFQSEAAYLTLTTNVVVTAIQEASLRDQLVAAREIVGSDREILQLMQRQFRDGQIAGADVMVQETVVAQAEAALAPLEKQLAQARDLMADLTGRAPSESEEPLELSSISLPDVVPVSLPARLVEQRPDIRAAEANLHAASALVGVATAQRLPNVVLFANAGGAATRVSDLFRYGNSFWAYGAGVAQPLFDAGSLYHRQRAAEATFAQAQAQYRSAVLAALQNVADTLQALDADGRALEASQIAESRAEASLAIARRRLARGQIAGPSVLLAEQAYQSTLQARAQAQASRYVDVAALFQALGGGWWNRKDVIESKGEP
jgi:NodT family efflux transporter outer membrane factor (OMF) lipoprotein